MRTRKTTRTDDAAALRRAQDSVFDVRYRMLGMSDMLKAGTCGVAFSNPEEVRKYIQYLGTKLTEYAELLKPFCDMTIQEG